MKPTLSIVIPCTKDRLVEVTQCVASLCAQSNATGKYELVVVFDGGVGDASGLEDMANDAGVGIQIKEFKRPESSPDVGHRNHTRNVGCRAAKADLVWIVAADALFPPHAVQSVLALHDKFPKSWSSPCLAKCGNHLKHWHDIVANNEDGANPYFLARRRGSAFSGMMSVVDEKAAASGTPSWHECDGPEEGMPCVQKKVGDALGWFDEAYVGWGGNAVSFTYRLRAQSRHGDLRCFVANSVVCILQPHTKATDYFMASLVQANGKRFDELCAQLFEGSDLVKADRSAIKKAYAPPKAKPKKKAPKAAESDSGEADEPGVVEVVPEPTDL